MSDTVHSWAFDMQHHTLLASDHSLASPGLYCTTPCRIQCNLKLYTEAVNILDKSCNQSHRRSEPRAVFPETSTQPELCDTVSDTP